MSVGFIMSRHVRCETTNKYWITGYEYIRKIYPDNTIMIIDDHSNPDFVKCDIPLHNCIIHQSPYQPQVAELLPYIYFYKTRPFDKAVIIQDAVFIQKPIEGLDDIKDVATIWSFTKCRCIEAIPILQKLNHTDALLHIFFSDDFDGCFGAMTVITLDFMTMLYEKYNMEAIIPLINNREMRMALERVLPILFRHSLGQKANSLFGDICCHLLAYTLTYDKYMNNLDKYSESTMVKIWSGR